MAKTKLAVVRLDDKDLAELQRQAKQKGLHPNVLIAEILKSHLKQEVNILEGMSNRF